MHDQGTGATVMVNGSSVAPSDEWVEATVNGAPAATRGSHGDCIGGRGTHVVTVAATVWLDFDDVVAALYLWVKAGATTWDELNDPAAARKLLVDSIVNDGLTEVADCRDRQVSDTPRGANWALDMCRDLVGRVFDLPAPACPVTAPLRALAVAR
jgi:hypothetical protein